MAFSCFRFVMILLSFALGSCSSFAPEPDISVPLQSSAKEQYLYATTYRSDKNLPLITSQKRFMVARQTVRAVFAMLPRHFPMDNFYTPLAKLELVEMDAGLDSPRVKVTNRQIKDAITQLNMLIDQYPDYAYIQAKSIYDRAMCHKRMGEYREAQQDFKLVYDRFMGHKTPSINELAQRSLMYYDETYIK